MELLAEIHTMLTLHKVQRESQAPILLDIDHPPLSPEPAAGISTPQRSPPLNSHIATSIQRLLPNPQIWESPAFLKRSRFTSSSYDPFHVDAEEEFPDNNRRKRSKFGHGSGQWRFADRTPSPEKELNIKGLEAASPYISHDEEHMGHNVAHLEPSKPKTIKDRTEVTGEGLHASELSMDVVGKDETNTEVNGVERQIDETTEILDDNASHAPPSPPSTAIGLSEAEGPKENPLANEVSPLSPRFRSPSSAPSESDRGSKSEMDENVEQDNGRDGAALNRPASDYGLDGSVFSRTQQFPKEPSPIESAIEPKEFTEISHGTIRSSEQVSDSISESGLEQGSQAPGEEPITIKESAHEFQIADGDDSSQYLKRDATEQNTDASLPLPPSPSIQLSEEQIVEGSPSDVVVTSAHVEVQEREPEAPGPNKDEMAMSVEKPPTSVVELAESQLNQKDAAESVTLPSKARDSKVEIIDLGSDEDEEDESQMISQQAIHSPPITSNIPMTEHLAHQPLYLFPAGSVTLDEPSPLYTAAYSPKALEHTRDAGPQSDLKDGKPPAQNDPQSPTSQTSIPSVAASAKEGNLLMDSTIESSSLRKSSPDIEAQRHSDDPREQDSSLLGTQDARTTDSGRESVAIEFPLSNELAEDIFQEEAAPVAEQISSPQPTNVQAPPKPTSGIETQADSKDSFIELPATIQDSVRVASSKSQLLTPDITQRSSFASQPSTTSLHSISDDDTLPTPRLTQSSDLVIPIALQQLQESVAADISHQSEKHERQLEKPQTPKEAFKMQRPPTLIEKLKAMKRLSSQTPQKKGDVSAISPWFAPKRSSQIVPDSEAESEIESLSENDRSSLKQNVTAKLQTPEKQRTLAQSFIRSPSRREDIHSMASSPGYLPPSQPPPPGFRTTLSYFVPLATLQSHFNLTVDILAVVLSATAVTRATTGPEDYNQIVYITDPSSSALKLPITTAQIFRSHNECFPVVGEGDAVLLRDFKVQSFQRQLSLLSTRCSAWAVFRRDADVQIRGPPVEFGAEERGFARGLWRWWAGLDQETKDGLVNTVPKDKKGKAIPADKRHNGRVHSKDKGPTDNKDVLNVKIKREGIAGLGVDLPGSQERKRRPLKVEPLEIHADILTSHGKTRKASLKERPLGLDDVLESTEPPKRVLRPRGARGTAERSASPMKALNRRSGTVFTGGLGEPKSD